MIANVLVEEFMQNHMFSVPDGLLCRHSGTNAHTRSYTLQPAASSAMDHDRPAWWDYRVAAWMGQE